ncbi:hypothetical protein ACFL1B_04285 [Nanoarchaeota archaeon]
MKLIHIPLLLLLAMPLVIGLGISPASIDLLFQPDAEMTINFLAYNSDSQEKQVSIGVSGELADYMTFESNTLYFKAGERSKAFTATLSLPMELQPGPNTAKVLLREMTRGQGQIAATVSIESTVKVMVPYPGKYIEVRLPSQDNPGKALIEARNLGQEDISLAKAHLTIYDRGNEVAQATSETKPIPSKATEYFTLPLEVNKPGAYLVNATVTHEEGYGSATKTFNIGEQVLRLIQATSSGNKNIEIMLDLFNDWNQELSQGYAEVIIDGETLPTLIESFQPYETRTLNTYWNAEGKEHKEYTLIVKTHFNGKTEETSIQATLTEQGLIIAGKSPISKSRVGLITIIIVITLLLAIIFIIIKRRKKNQLSWTI